MYIPIIFGEKGSTKTEECGEFFCPFCREQQDYQLVVNSVTYFVFVPIGPTTEVGRYVYCDECGNDFPCSVLESDGATELMRDSFAYLLLRAAIEAARADGQLNPQRIEAIQDACEKHIARPDVECVIEEVRCIQNQGDNVVDQLRQIGPRLDTNEQNKILRAVADVFSTEKPSDSQQEFAATVAMSLGFDGGRLRQLK